MGHPPATSLAWRISSRPGGRAPLLRRRLPHRPRAHLVGAGVAGRGERRVELIRRVGGEADQGALACQRPGLGDRRVVLADVNAVGAARLDQLGVVVQEEERAVAIGRAAKRVRERDELFGTARRLLAKLDHVGAAAERGFEERLGIAIAGTGVADEVEAGGLKARQA